MKQKNNILITDLETGGFMPDKNPLTELGILVIDGETFEEKYRYNTYVKPYDDSLYMTKDAIKLTGITPELCEEKGKPLEEVVSDVTEIFKKEKNSYFLPVLAGHNLAFDMGYYEDIFNRIYGPNTGKMGKCKIFDFVSDVVLDTMILARINYIENEVENFQLGTIGKYLGFENTKAHDSMGDIEQTTNVLRAFLLRMRNGGSVDMSKFSAGKNFNFQF